LQISRQLKKQKLTKEILTNQEAEKPEKPITYQKVQPPKEEYVEEERKNQPEIQADIKESSFIEFYLIILGKSFSIYQTF